MHASNRLQAAYGIPPPTATMATVAGGSEGRRRYYKTFVTCIMALTSEERKTTCSSVLSVIHLENRMKRKGKGLTGKQKQEAGGSFVAWLLHTRRNSGRAPDGRKENCLGRRSFSSSSRTDRIAGGGGCRRRSGWNGLSEGAALGFGCVAKVTSGGVREIFKCRFQISTLR